MTATVLIAATIFFVAAYRFYGRFLDRGLGISPDGSVPSRDLQDGVDYVPTRSLILFGHHFSSIAGAGPIVGPIIAGLAFGWLPALLWIIVGAIFVGGVHDFSSLVASIRHRGRSIAEIAQEYMPRAVYLAFLTFIWLTLVYVLIVFLDLVAAGFAPPRPELARAGGTVATASLCYIVLAILFGLSIYRFRIPQAYGALVFVPLVFLFLWVGYRLPLTPDKLPLLWQSPKKTWYVVLLLYCFAASSLPVWVLLQPRDFLSSFLLYACLLMGAVGMLISSLKGTAATSYPAFLVWKDPHLGSIYPALFITVACGAVSGFHSLVSSGTTSKQLDCQSSARPIAYGSMLIEGILAVVALGTIMILSRRPTSAAPIGLFAQGMGKFLSALGIPVRAGTAFGLLAISTFLLTTLDTTTRLARFIFQEFTGLWNWSGRLLGSLLSLAVTGAAVFQQIRSPDGNLVPAWKAIWPAFGTTNQLLAALALAVVYTWLRRNGRKGWFILLPCLFMAGTTLTSLVLLSVRNLGATGNRLIGGVSLGMLVLALFVLWSAASAVLKHPREEQASA
ncbi:MAG TPA: carbon starvation protein A [Kiritimatiellae bacterium]|nr:carbon starvation protein A [Kiritimatiellia bacterium]